MKVILIGEGKTVYFLAKRFVSNNPYPGGVFPHRRNWLACTHQCGIIWLGNPKNKTEPRLMATALRR